jgi:SAM-dependent methyltransferase
MPSQGHVPADPFSLVQDSRPVPHGYSRGAPIPWAAKLALKMALARLPASRGLWRRLGAFRNTPREELERRVIGNLGQHWDAYRAARGAAPAAYLELGVGDTLGRALAARALGARETILIDVEAYAETDMAHYRQLDAALPAYGLPRVLGAAQNVGEMLETCGARYLTGGLDSLRALPSASIDLLVSEAVLEHLPLGQFAAFGHEMRRVLGPAGLAIHNVDFHDHLGGRLNHLRFSRRLWEGDLFRRSGFYTNRIAFSAMVAALQDSGFAVSVPSMIRWLRPPLKPGRAHPDAGWTQKDLTVCSAWLVCTPADPA